MIKSVKMTEIAQASYGDNEFDDSFGDTNDQKSADPSSSLKPSASKDESA